ncbi:MAG: hypothetical protein NC412_13945 [Roseburia sp.]|nr:hypothetical protein [Roseburia sp.]MCM1280200.1 hypothetical protein [Robinsoniella sp.]
MIDKKMEDIENVITREVARKIECISFEDYISRLVEKEVQKVMNLIIRGIQSQSL